MAFTAVLMLSTAAFSWSYVTRPFMYLRTATAQTSANSPGPAEHRPEPSTRSHDLCANAGLHSGSASTHSHTRQSVCRAQTRFGRERDDPYWGMESNSGTVRTFISLTEVLSGFLPCSSSDGWSSAAPGPSAVGSPSLR